MNESTKDFYSVPTTRTRVRSIYNFLVFDSKNIGSFSRRSRNFQHRELQTDGIFQPPSETSEKSTYCELNNFNDRLSVILKNPLIENIIKGHIGDAKKEDLVVIILEKLLENYQRSLTTSQSNIVDPLERADIEDPCDNLYESKSSTESKNRVSLKRIKTASIGVMTEVPFEVESGTKNATKEDKINKSPYDLDSISQHYQNLWRILSKVNKDQIQNFNYRSEKHILNSDSSKMFKKAAIDFSEILKSDREVENDNPIQPVIPIDQNFDFQSDSNYFANFNQLENSNLNSKDFALLNSAIIEHFEVSPLKDREDSEVEIDSFNLNKNSGSQVSFSQFMRFLKEDPNDNKSKDFCLYQKCSDLELSEVTNGVIFKPRTLRKEDLHEINQVIDQTQNQMSMVSERDLLHRMDHPEEASNLKISECSNLQLPTLKKEIENIERNRQKEQSNFPSFKSIPQDDKLAINYHPDKSLSFQKNDEYVNNNWLNSPQKIDNNTNVESHSFKIIAAPQLYECVNKKAFLKEAPLKIYTISPTKLLFFKPSILKRKFEERRILRSPAKRQNAEPTLPFLEKETLRYFVAPPIRSTTTPIIPNQHQQELSDRQSRPSRSPDTLAYREIRWQNHQSTVLSSSSNYQTYTGSHNDQTNIQCQFYSNDAVHSIPPSKDIFSVPSTETKPNSPGLFYKNELIMPLAKPKQQKTRIQEKSNDCKTVTRSISPLESSSLSLFKQNYQSNIEEYKDPNRELHLVRVEKTGNVYRYKEDLFK
jgi:hypothetical protein